ncbi:benzoate/H(+) symporter BenE family transporter (plasmid) [Pseudarthrobacter sp. P1]|uniref:benzoate/H(+) symporter BenE family transporter n=1 Tax=Pseudarthrobacter sp. P1 TaxID=3418418 RepID=UPI003CEB9DBD
MVYGILALVCALLAPTLTRLMLATPKEFILALGGIAMLRALQQAFVTAFATAFTLGSLETFVVTLSGMSLQHPPGVLGPRHRLHCVPAARARGPCTPVGGPLAGFIFHNAR